MLNHRFTLCLFAAILAPGLITSCSKGSKQARFVKSADGYFQAGEYEKAKIEYMNLLKADPGNAVAIERLGKIWADQGAPLRALQFLRETRKLAPENIEARLQLGMVFLSLGGVGDARGEALSILEHSPDNGRALGLFVDCSKTPEELSAAEDQLRKFPAQNTARFLLAAASVALRRGNVAGAEELLQRALSADPKFPDVHAANAMLHLVQKHPEKAGEELKAAAALAPVRSGHRTRYANFLVQTRQLDLARTALNETTRQAPDYFPAWLALAQLALTEAKYDEALKSLDEVLRQDPENLEARLLQGQTFLQKGEVKTAVESLERLDKTYPGVTAVKYHLARAYLKSNQGSEAVSALNQVVAASPDLTEAVLLLAELNLRMGNPQPVVAALTGLLTKQPDLAPAQLLLAQAYAASGRLEEGAGVLRDQIKTLPKNPQAHFLLGTILRQQNKTSEAKQTFEKAQELAPDDLSILFQLVDLELSAKQYVPALERIHLQLQKTPDSAAAHFLEARVFVAQNDWDRAEAALTKTLELDPNFSRAYDLLIATYVSANKLQAAVDQVNGLLAKTPGNPPALMLAALIYEKKLDFPKARESYEKLLAINPNFVPALNNLAYLYLQRFNEIDKAYELAQRARQLPSPQPLSAASVADTLGWIHYKRGEYQTALTFVQESASKIGADPEVQFHLGMAYYMMGQLDPARRALKLAAEGANDFPGKSEIKSRLEMLGGEPGTPALPVAELERLAQSDPRDPIAQLLLAEAFEKESAFAKASATYERALELNPGLVSAARKLAKLYEGPLNNPAKAAEFAATVRKLAPNDPEATAVLGTVAYQNGDFPKAYELLRETARQPSAGPVVQRAFAWAAYRMGRVSEAREAMQRALDAGLATPLSAEAKSFLGLTSIDADSKDAAQREPEIQSALKADPQSVPALMAQAALRLQRDESAGLATTYTDVLSHFPDFVPAQIRLAALYASDPSTLSKASDLAMAARKAQPDDPEVAAVLGEINYKKGEFAFALQLLQESARKRPLGARERYFLGMCYFETKEPEKCQEALKSALADGLKEPLATEAKRVLEEIAKK